MQMTLYYIAISMILLLVIILRLILILFSKLLKLQDLYKLKIPKLYYIMVANNVSYSHATYKIRNHSYQIHYEIMNM